MKIKLVYFIFFNLLVFNLSLFAQAKPIKVACIGNSVTYGFNIAKREENCYPVQLQTLLGDGYKVKNFGHSGATLLKNGHNPYYKTDEFSNAIIFKPDVAIIDLGLNDTDPRDWPDYRTNFKADYSWLINALRKSNPAVKIYVCLMTPIFSGHPRFKSGTRDWYWQIQHILPNISRANQTGLIDLHTPLYNRPDLFADNIHPDKEGAGIIARTVFQSLTGKYGKVKLEQVFANDMVMQRQHPIPVYGSADVGFHVEVTFNHHTISTVADNKGNWKVFFPAMEAGGPYQMTVKSEDTLIRIKNILIGDIWLCSGQSNMAFPLSKSTGEEQEIQSNANNSRLRLFKYDVLKETDPIQWDSSTLRKVNQLKYFSGTWKESNQLSAAEFSAVAYYFGIALYAKEHVPIGLIQVAVGGSPIESWIDRYTMEHDDLLVDMISNWRKSDFVMKWCRDRADTNLAKASSPKQRHPYEPCYNYEAGIDQLTGFPIKGVIWYQGESNAQNPELYSHLFKTLVSSWRQNWGYTFPFYFVQLSSINRPSWPVFREMERHLYHQIPDCAMATSIDLGDSLNVHYINKKPVGERLALLAEKYTYKNNVVADGPVPSYAKQHEHEITITFPVHEKLQALSNQLLNGFEIVTEKGTRITPEAVVKNNVVTLSYSTDEQITDVYYAMQPYAHGNLYNKSGLPASTFILHRFKDIFY
jgi:sialate O-acetylesterase